MKQQYLFLAHLAERPCELLPSLGFSCIVKISHFNHLLLGKIILVPTASVV
jgi:hypothetical protein